MKSKNLNRLSRIEETRGDPICLVYAFKIGKSWSIGHSNVGKYNEGDPIKSIKKLRKKKNITLVEYHIRPQEKPGVIT